MDDSDIAHSIMTVKEMEHANYGLNDHYYDEFLSNHGILSG